MNAPSPKETTPSANIAFAEMIRRLRKHLGLTQAKAAEMLDVSSQWISNCERGILPSAVSQAGAIAIYRAAIQQASKDAVARAQAEHDAHRAADAAYAEIYNPSIVDAPSGIAPVVTRLYVPDPNAPITPSASVQAARARYLKRQEEIAQQMGE